MELKYNRTQRKEYLNMTGRIGLKWLEIFQGNTEFYSAVYWDLLTKIWETDGPVRKTDAMRFMTSIKSAHTAGKYVESAIHHGFIEETDNPEDARSKLLRLAPEMRERLDVFFDAAVGELQKSSQTINSIHSPPAEAHSP
jgi:hypothetical protein